MEARGARERAGARPAAGLSPASLPAASFLWGVGGGGAGGEVQRGLGWPVAPKEANSPLTLCIPLSGQVNNATARVMTNKKTANPYTNGKGPGTPGAAGAQAADFPGDECPSIGHLQPRPVRLLAFPSIHGTQSPGAQATSIAAR